jgi:hypothetical protein
MMPRRPRATCATASAKRYVKLGGQTVAEVTDLLDTAPPRR